MIDQLVAVMYSVLSALLLQEDNITAAHVAITVLQKRQLQTMMKTNLTINAILIGPAIQVATKPAIVTLMA